MPLSSPATRLEAASTYTPKDVQTERGSGSHPLPFLTLGCLHFTTLAKPLATGSPWSSGAIFLYPLASRDHVGLGSLSLLVAL